MILVFSIASAGFVLTRVPPSPVSLDSTIHTSLIDFGMVSASTESPETRSANFMHVSLHTPVSDHIFSLNIPSISNHDDDNVSPVLEWDDLFEEPLLSVDLYPLVHPPWGDSMGVPTVPSTPVHWIERDVTDQAHRTLTNVIIHLVSPVRVLTPPLH